LADKDWKKTIAKRAIALLDLTNLDEACTLADIDQLCQRAQTPYGNTAAICIWKEFVEHAKSRLLGTGVRIATVVNFPAGSTDTDAVLAEVSMAIVAGADEIDLVFPYRAFLEGDLETCIDQMARVRDACRPPVLLKVIIESGELNEDSAIQSASRLAIDCGADFIKTSTGKVKVNATPHTAQIMMTAIRDSGKPVGFKPAGGIRTLDDAAAYLAIADEIMGREWASQSTFRFGASGVLTNLLAVLNDEAVARTEGGY
jgi:deoxyribose-phosphate aldolase